MNEKERKVFRTRGLTIEVAPASDIDENDIYCRLCECCVQRQDLKRWSGDDSLHYPWPGCDSNLLPVELLD